MGRFVRKIKNSRVNNKLNDIQLKNKIVKPLLHEKSVKTSPNNFKKKPIKHIFIFGNDDSINNFDFTIFKKNNIITAGVNRIWKKYKPDYIYFSDKPIQEGLKKEKIEMKDTILLISNYTKRKTKVPFDQKFLENTFKSIEHHKYDFSKLPFVFNDSVTHLIYQLKKFVFSEYYCIFYICGVSLIWKKRHHFWVGDKTVKDELPKSYFISRFNKIFTNMCILKKMMDNGEFYMYNCNLESRLNKILDYIDVNEAIKMIKINIENGKS